MTKREQVALRLDPRTKGNLRVMSKEQWNKAEIIFKQVYAEFYATCKTFDSKHQDSSQKNDAQFIEMK